MHNLRLETLREYGIISNLDIEFSYAISDMSGENNNDALLAFALARRAPRYGHTCLDIENAQWSDIAEDTYFTRPPKSLSWPSTEQFRQALLQSQALSVNDKQEVAPLILHKNMLYLQKYDAMESKLVSLIKERIEEQAYMLEEDDLVLLDSLFSSDKLSPGDSAQRHAAELALSSRFTVITGGPGTGKTTTVLRILTAFLARSIRAGNQPDIALLAPTGKAASRLIESISQGIQRLPLDTISKDIIEALPVKASTIHRALGIHPDRPSKPRHHSNNPLPADIVVVDETSMVDLPLMAALLDAVKPNAALMLIGDPDQLASVNAGAVLKDIVETTQLHNHVASLSFSRRFSDESKLGKLVSAIKTDDTEQVLDHLKAENSEEVKLTIVESDQIPTEIIVALDEFSRQLAQAPTDQEALEELSRFRLLTALRIGPAGAEALNSTMAKRNPTRELVHGTPILITTNSPESDLANGDLGIIRTAPDGSLRFVLPGPDGPRYVPVSRLPEFEYAWAMTIHKSQGSEFDHVMILLPQATSAILSRELLFTAVSRARKSIHILAPEGAVEAAHKNRVKRATGLRERIG